MQCLTCEKLLLRKGDEKTGLACIFFLKMAKKRGFCGIMKLLKVEDVKLFGRRKHA